jgi:hypothetical protein
MLLSLSLSVSGRALEPQTLYNFQVSPGSVTGALVEGPDGNFYGTTTRGGPTGILSSTDVWLPVTSWTALTSSVFDMNGQFSFTDAGAASAKVRFYRKTVP